MKQTIGVIGLGFVGLSTALGFAHQGLDVYAYDMDKERCARIAAKEIPFYEPHLQEALQDYLGDRFHIQESLPQVIRLADVIFICVGTPASSNGDADLSYLFHAVQECGQTIIDSFSEGETKFKTLVIKSTVPPTTSKKTVTLLNEMGLNVGDTIGLGNNPEFLREGFAWEDFIHPDRIVIGADDSKTKEVLMDVYQSFAAPLYDVSLNNAEYIKYLSNCLLATLVSFSNEMATVADLVGEIDIRKSFQILHMDKRWNGSPAKMTSYVYPGCGFGGYCLPKDTEAFYALSKQIGAPAEILEAVLKQNAARKQYIAEKIMKMVSNEQRVAILGLSFKPGSDDVRDTPAYSIIRSLLNADYTNIVAYDPMAMGAFQQMYVLPIQYAQTLEQAIEQTDVVVILTAWDEFKSLTNYKIPNIIDGRFCLDLG